MAYQAKRNKVFKEEFQLVDENGKIVKTIFVELDPSAVAQNLSRKYIDLQKALATVNKAKQNKERMYETAGNAMKDILETVFGEEETKTIIEFYEERYIEMCKEVLPFVSEIVVPQVRKIEQENRANVIAGYNRRAKRAALFGKKRW